MEILKTSALDDKPGWVEEYTKRQGLRQQGFVSQPLYQSVQGLQGIQGAQGAQGTQGISGPCGLSGEQGIIGIASSSEDLIEKKIEEVLKKYNLIPDGVEGTSHPCNIGNAFQLDKTFTLEEVINIVDSLPNRNINIHGIFEDRTEVLIDKNELIKKLKEK